MLRNNESEVRRWLFFVLARKSLEENKALKWRSRKQDITGVRDFLKEVKINHEKIEEGKKSDDNLSVKSWRGREQAQEDAG